MTTIIYACKNDQPRIPSFSLTQKCKVQHWKGQTWTGRPRPLEQKIGRQLLNNAYKLYWHTSYRNGTPDIVIQQQLLQLSRHKRETSRISEEKKKAALTSLGAPCMNDSTETCLSPEPSIINSAIKTLPQKPRIASANRSIPFSQKPIRTILH